MATSKGSSNSKTSTRFDKSQKLIERSVFVPADSAEKQLCAKIQRFYFLKRQSDGDLTKKERTMQYLENVIKENFDDGAKLCIHGSTLNGCGTNSSDMDLSLFCSPSVSFSTADRETIVSILKNNTDTKHFEYRGKKTVKVPIVRGIYPDTDVLWEIEFGKAESILATRLLRAYTQLDSRTAPLAVLIKLWAEEKGIKNAFHGSLCSFSWVLLLIGYLQCGCSPPVLPCLQKDHPDKYDRATPDAVTAHNSIFDPVPSYPPSQNRQNLAQLLKGFFDFYANVFNPKEEVVSVKTGKLIRKKDVIKRPPKEQWKFFCIEAPYGTNDNVAHSMRTKEEFEKILTEIRDAHESLKYNNSLPILGD